MGALGALLVGLFSLCFRKLKTKQETKTRIIILIAVAVVFAIVVVAVGEQGGWSVFAIFALLFGWRLIADVVRLFTNKFEPTDETEQDDKEATNATDAPSNDDESEDNK